MPDLEETLNRNLFDFGLQIKHLLDKIPFHKPTPGAVSGLKLSKIDIFNFDGNIRNWGIFWEQFGPAIHSMDHLSGADELAYLQYAFRNGTAKQVKERLTRSEGSFNEAILCHEKRYDHPHLIHQVHVRAILEAVALKDRRSRELRRLYDVETQHLRAVRVLEYVSTRIPWQ